MTENLTAEERAELRARHRKNTDLSPRSYCTNRDHLHGDHAWAADRDSSFTDWPCPVIRLLDELERPELSEPASVSEPAPELSLFDAIRAAQNLTDPGNPHDRFRTAQISEYINGQADLICALYDLPAVIWRDEIAAEIRQEHGKWVRTDRG